MREIISISIPREELSSMEMPRTFSPSEAKGELQSPSPTPPSCLPFPITDFIPKAVPGRGNGQTLATTALR